MDYVVKMDGEKVRCFSGVRYESVLAWSKTHCHGEVSIIKLSDCGELPHASHRIYPDQSLPNLVYKPFASLS